MNTSAFFSLNLERTDIISSIRRKSNTVAQFDFILNKKNSISTNRLASMVESIGDKRKNSVFKQSFILEKKNL